MNISIFFSEFKDFKRIFVEEYLTVSDIFVLFATNTELNKSFEPQTSDVRAIIQKYSKSNLKIWNETIGFFRTVWKQIMPVDNLEPHKTLLEQADDKLWEIFKTDKLWQIYQAEICIYQFQRDEIREMETGETKTPYLRNPIASVIKNVKGSILSAESHHKWAVLISILEQCSTETTETDALELLQNDPKYIRSIRTMHIRDYFDDSIKTEVYWIAKALLRGPSQIIQNHFNENRYQYLNTHHNFRAYIYHFRSYFGKSSDESYVYVQTRNALFHNPESIHRIHIIVKYLDMEDYFIHSIISITNAVFFYKNAKDLNTVCQNISNKTCKSALVFRPIAQFFLNAVSDLPYTNIPSNSDLQISSDVNNYIFKSYDKLIDLAIKDNKGNFIRSIPNKYIKESHVMNCVRSNNTSMLSILEQKFNTKPIELEMADHMLKTYMNHQTKHLKKKYVPYIKAFIDDLLTKDMLSSKDSINQTPLQFKPKPNQTHDMYDLLLHNDEVIITPSIIIAFCASYLQKIHTLDYAIFNLKPINPLNKTLTEILTEYMYSECLCVTSHDMNSVRSIHKSIEGYIKSQVYYLPEVIKIVKHMNIFVDALNTATNIPPNLKDKMITLLIDQDYYQTRKVIIPARLAEKYMYMVEVERQRLSPASIELLEQSIVPEGKYQILINQSMKKLFDNISGLFN